MTKQFTIKKLKFWHLMFINFIASTCCIIYELNLAQLLSATLGNTAQRYSITVGIYLAAMGFGAIFLSPEKDSNDLDDLVYRLIKIELALTILGLLSPAIIITVDAYTRYEETLKYLNSGIGYTLVLLIGLFTGAELPTLIQMGTKVSSTRSYYLIIIDYVGTLFGSITFPFIFLINLGVVSTSFYSSFTNLAVAILLFINTTKKRSFFLLFFIVMFAFYLYLSLNMETINYFLTKKVYLR